MKWWKANFVIVYDRQIFSFQFKRIERKTQKIWNRDRKSARKRLKLKQQKYIRNENGKVSIFIILLTSLFRLYSLHRFFRFSFIINAFHSSRSQFSFRLSSLCNVSSSEIFFVFILSFYIKWQTLTATFQFQS